MSAVGWGVCQVCSLGVEWSNAGVFYINSADWTAHLNSTRIIHFRIVNSCVLTDRCVYEENIWSGLDWKSVVNVETTHQVTRSTPLAPYGWHLSVVSHTHSALANLLPTIMFVILYLILIKLVCNCLVVIQSVLFLYCGAYQDAEEGFFPGESLCYVPQGACWICPPWPLQSDQADSAQLDKCRLQKEALVCESAREERLIQGTPSTSLRVFRGSRLMGFLFLRVTARTTCLVLCP